MPKKQTNKKSKVGVKIFKWIKALVTGVSRRSQLTMLSPQTEGGLRVGGLWRGTESPESLRGCECDLEMVCAVYMACLEGCASAGGRTLLAWEARRSDPTSLSVSHSASHSSCSGACDGLGKINASSTACREIKLVYSHPEMWRV